MPPVRRILGPYRVTLCLVLLVLILRRPESAIFNPQFWAEDGAVYARDQLVHGYVAAFRSYYGYLQLLPRLTAVLAAPFPVSWWPAIFNTVALIMAAACLSLFSLTAYRNLIASDGLRVACCLLSAAVFNAPEIIGNMVNIQWFLLAGVTLILFRQPPARGIRWLPVALLCSLTCPVLLILVPICLWRCWMNGLRCSVFEAGLIGGSVIELVLFLTQATASPATNASHGAPGLVRAVVFSSLFRVFLENLLGTWLARALTAAFHPLYVLAALAIVAAWLVWLWMRSGSDGRIHLAVAAYLWLGALAICLSGRDGASYFSHLSGFQFGVYDRYFFFPLCILVFLTARSIEELGLGKRRIAPILLILFFAMGLWQNYRAPDLIDFNWPGEVAAIELQRQAHASGRPVYEPLTVPINPEGWVMSIP